MHTLLRIRPTAALRSTLLAGTILIVLGGCQERRDPEASQEMTWAKAALERNPNLEVVATDARAGVFTVRDRSTGEVVAVTPAELAAAPIAQFTAPAAVPAGPASEEPVSETAAAASAPATEDDSALQAGAAPTADAGGDASSAAIRKEYTIERVDGRVKVSGPGLSIVSGGGASPAPAGDSPRQRTVDPIICEGRRMMHFDDRDIYVTGDAITVRGGCELFITNSRIVATGTGVVVRDGIAHIDNSYVEGTGASFDAAAESRLYLRGSTFQGMSRRDSRAMIQDQGGNRLR